MSNVVFDLSKDGLDTGLSDSYVEYLLGAAKNCLVKSDQKPGVVAKVGGDITGGIEFHWDGISEEEKNTYVDQTTATEKGAEGIAFIVVDRFTDYKVFAQSYIGTGYDFFLIPKNRHATLLTMGEVYIKLEVSGVQKENNQNKVSTRVDVKVKQVNTLKDNKEYYVVVSEFGEPRVEVKHGCSHR